MNTIKTVLKFILLKYKKGAIIGGIIVAILVTGIPSLYFYNQYQKTVKYMNDPTLKDKEKTQEIVSKVSRHMALPKDEDPTIATVSDKEKLKDQPFFQNAKNGDKVLIFTNAKKAILYDPVADLILEVASINPPQAQSSQSAQVAGAQTQNAQQPSGPMTFALLNGTGKTGLTVTYEQELKSKIPTSTITERGNAKASTYTETILVDVTGKRGAEAQALAKTLNITYSPLPAGEVSPVGADFLVIVGGDKK
jgi:hypothetical protein